ncbi:hypothetical protein L198_06687 [Cryptococcus wingfieldii CBS 7118]|uniref:Uncharacterized protein n=1 Tax=Cryptococcus wingfieldii CBS 7118 TaxID=1295528 RepID=A0A1E3IKD8_9TREE|nr:hypothetical protein L198_06687 [Cryptococcus wingfieldii CBS 7118]ODN88416.1 hypothetical protein L198_06687 [Cryptococcus wingfieldii CBS 7118]
MPSPVSSEVVSNHAPKDHPLLPSDPTPFSGPALPSDILALIFPLYVSVACPGSKAFTNLLCLNREIHDKNINRAYERITLTKDNVDAFFKPWWDWCEMAEWKDTRDYKRKYPDGPLNDGRMSVRTWLGTEENVARNRYITFADSCALYETARFLQRNPWERWVDSCRQTEFKKSPQRLFENLHHITYPASLFQPTSICHVAWGMHRASLTKARYVCIEMPPWPISKVAIDALRSPFTGKSSPWKLTVHNCSSFIDVPLLDLESDTWVEVFMGSPKDTSGSERVDVEDMEFLQDHTRTNYFSQVFGGTGWLTRPNFVVHHAAQTQEDIGSVYFDNDMYDGEKMTIYTDDECRAHEELDCMCGLKVCQAEIYDLTSDEDSEGFEDSGEDSPISG